MKAKYIKEGASGACLQGKVYEVLAVEYGLGKCYRVIDESGEDYLYPATAFEIVEQESRQVA